MRPSKYVIKMEMAGAFAPRLLLKYAHATEDL
jgi:hypothetical protein